MTKTDSFVKQIRQRQARKSHRQAIVYKNWRNKQNRLILEKGPQPRRPSHKSGKLARLKRDEHIRRKEFDGYADAIAPKDFSFRTHPEAAIKFITKLEKLYQNDEKVFVVLRDVCNLGYDAIVVLLSVMIRFKAKKIDFNGDFPVNYRAKNKLVRSEFFKNLYSEFEDKDEYNVGRQNAIWTRGKKDRVESDMTAPIIENAAQSIWGEKRRCQGAQNVLNELMVNTWEHAHLDVTGYRHSWLSVNHNKAKRVVSFSFIDYGVGIFTSLKNKKTGSKYHGSYGRMKDIFGLKKNCEAFKKIMDGEMQATTITNGHHRGRGLPGLKLACERNQIRNLYIVTNDVAADVTKGVYKELKNSLNGTFVYFELSSENRNFPLDPEIGE